MYPTQHLDRHENSISHTIHIAAGQAGRALGLRGGGAARDTTTYLRSQRKRETSKQAKPARTDEQERDTHKAASIHTQQRRSQTRAGQGLGRERTLARIAAQEGSRSARPGMAEHGKEGGVGAGEAVL